MYWKDENKEKEAENGPFLKTKTIRGRGCRVLDKYLDIIRSEKLVLEFWYCKQNHLSFSLLGFLHLWAPIETVGLLI